MIENYLRDRLKKKKILLMTHIVMGYPNFEDSMAVVEAMVRGGVDLMELQIPFSEPMADGPVILKANQKALAAGATVEKCMTFAETAASRFDIPFLFMTYYNIIHKYGVERFAGTAAKAGIKGAIIPDLPPEEGEAYLEAFAANGLAPIFIFAPTTSDARMQYLNTFARGFVYCVARKGVTGSQTDFSQALGQYLKRCRAATALPLALGFGISEKSDVTFLEGKADIAVIGTRTIRVVEENGVGAVEAFIRGLR